MTYTVYNDYDSNYGLWVQDVRTYAGWNGTTATDPTQVTLVNREYGFIDTISMTAPPIVSGGVPTGQESIGSLRHPVTRSCQ